MANIVPFGKYKNQPVEVLAQDKGYCEWLAAQGWVAARFPELHTLIINNFAEPTETPEHNRLQLRFANADFRAKTSAAILHVLAPRKLTEQERLAEPSPPVFEHNAIDVAWNVCAWDLRHTVSDEQKLTDIYHAKRKREDDCKTTEDYAQVRKDFADIDKYAYGRYRIEVFQWIAWNHGLAFAIECKPSLGDDYPAVLRFIRTAKFDGFWGLVIQNFQAQGGSYEEVQFFFKQSNVALLTLAEIEATAPLPYIIERDLPNPLVTPLQENA